MARSKSLPLLVFLVLLAGLIGSVWMFSETDTAPDEAGTTPAVTAEAPRSGAAKTVQADAGERPAAMPVERTTRTEVAPADETGDKVVISGRIVRDDGAPAAKLGLGILAVRALDDVTEIVAGDFEPRQVETDSAGRFAFEMNRGERGRLIVERASGLLFDDPASGRLAGYTIDTDLGDLLVARGGVIAGRVVDELGRPAAGVSVRLGGGLSGGSSMFGRGNQVETDASGDFEFVGLRAGEHDLTTYSPNYVPGAETVEIAKGESRRDVLITLAVGATIAGRVLDDRGQPIEGARVASLRERDVNRVMRATRIDSAEAVETDADGRFVLAGIDAPAVGLQAWADGHGRASVPNVTVGTNDLEIALDRRGAIRGVLVDTAGKPIRGSRVRASARQLMGRMRMIERGGGAETGADGAFVLDAVDAGDVTVSATGDGHRPVRESLTVRPGEVLEGVRLVASVGAAIDVVVVDADGAPVPGATVEVTEHEQDNATASRGRTVNRRVRVDNDNGRVTIGDGPEVHGSGKTDGEGKVRIAGLPPGPVGLRSTHSELAPSVKQAVTLPDEGVAEAVLTMSPGGFIEVTTRTSDGVPDGEARYTVRGPLGSGDPESDRGRTDATGTKRLGPLAEGTYDVLLEMPPKLRDLGGRMSFSTDDGQVLEQTAVRCEVRAGVTSELTLIAPVLTTLTGVVTDANGVVAGAQVSVAEADTPENPLGGSYSATTDADGNYTIDGVPAGEYEIRFGRPDALIKNRAPIQFVANQPAANRDLRIRGGAVKVTVLDAEDSLPIERAEVTLRRVGAEGEVRQPRMVMMTINQDASGGSSSMEMRTNSARVRTDEDGVALLEDVPPDKYNVVVEHKKYETARVRDIEVVDGQVHEAGTLELRAGGMLRGKVEGLGDGPLRIAIIEVAKVGSDDPPKTETSMDGTFRVTSLSPGRYRVRARAARGGPGGWSEPREVEVFAGRWANVTVDLAPK